jgi:hypothetical protein
MLMLALNGGARYHCGLRARRVIAKAKQCSQWSVIEWVTKTYYLAPQCFGRHVKPFLLVAFAVVCTHSNFKEG